MRVGPAGPSQLADKPEISLDYLIVDFILELEVYSGRLKECEITRN
jgi:hypothetical protein